MVNLALDASAEGARPDFSPSGTRAELVPVPANASLPPGAVHPARRAVIEVGPSENSWLSVLLTAAPDEPGILTRLYVDANRNGDFADDGPPAIAIVRRSDNGDAQVGFDDVLLPVRFDERVRAEPMNARFWLFQRGDDSEPDGVIRYMNKSFWRTGTTTVRGVPVLVAAMDISNDAWFEPGDYWSVVEASMPEAETRLLSREEVRPTDRLMFVQRGARESDVVLEFRSFAPDGSSVTFAAADYPRSKSEDRQADDLVAAERMRPRATTPYEWMRDLGAAMSAASTSGKPVFLYFVAAWCAPCKTMDEFVWTDAEVADALRSDYVGVKLDGDVEAEIATRYSVRAYPSVMIVDPETGAVRRSAIGYQSSQRILSFLAGGE